MRLSSGVRLALAAALISGVSIYVNAFAVRQVPDAAVYTTLKNGVAALVLLGLLAPRGAVVLRSLTPRTWAGLAFVGAIGGSIPFVLFFTGLTQASAPTAAFIQKTLFVWVAVLAVPLLGERLGRAQLGALGLLVVAQVLVAPPSGVRWGNGETLIAIATILWAVEVIVAKRLLGSIDARVLAAGRMGFGLILLVGFVALTGKLGVIAGLQPAAWGSVLVTGLLLTGYVAAWYGALQRAPASLVTAVLVVGAVVTAGLQALGSAAWPAPSMVAGYGLMAVAVAAVVVAASRGGVMPGRTSATEGATAPSA